MKVFVRRPSQSLPGVLGSLSFLLLVVSCGASDSDSMAGVSGSGGSATGGTGGTAGTGAQGGQDAGCTEGQFLCEGSVAWRCDAYGERVDPVDCADESKVCVEGFGCATCAPGATSCADGIGTYCVEDGSGVESFACDPAQGLTCNPDGCVGACTPRLLGNNHVGCDFWPTVTANSAWGQWFPFGVVVANTTDEMATVRVTRGEETLVERTLAAGGVEEIELPWIAELKGASADEYGNLAPPEYSVISKVAEGGGAFRLRSDQPVVVTQFNTLRASDPEGLASGCPSDPSGQCLSSSNDASLLLPAHALDSMHVLMGWHAWGMETTNQPGTMGDFLSVTALEDGTSVTVTPNSPVLPFEGEEPIVAGEPRAFELERGDVLQLFSDGTTPGAQWSGSLVTANHPIQVLTGAPCVNVPESAPTCDHVEESNLPLSMVGKRYLVMAPEGPSGRNRHVVRVHGIEDGTLVEFDPSTAHKSITVNEGEVVELDLPKTTEEEPAPNFLVSSTKRFGVTQYMAGNQAPPYDPYAPYADLGDPAQTFVVPTSRYLKRYAIALPAGFEQHRVAIVAATGAEVYVDEEAIPAASFQAVGASGLSVVKLDALAPSARHVLKSDKPFGVQVYGFGPFTSYMFPGGIDLRPPSQ